MPAKPTVLKCLCLSVFLAGVVGARAQGPRWVETAEWEGPGTRFTPVFHVNTERWRLRVTNLSAASLKVTVFDETGERQAVSRALGNSYYMYKDLGGSGRYYLKIEGDGGRWKVAVHQYLSTIQEWELLQEVRKPNTPLMKFATWTGGSGTEEVVFSPGAPHWKLRAELNGEGQGKVSLVDQSDGVALLKTTLTRPGVYETWIHRDGTFTLIMDADDMQWRIDGLSP